MQHVQAENPTTMSHTLCGYTDTATGWIETKRRVNCEACIEVRNHVMGKKAKTQKKVEPNPPGGFAVLADYYARNEKAQGATRV